MILNQNNLQRKCPTLYLSLFLLFFSALKDNIFWSTNPIHFNVSAVIAYHERRRLAQKVFCKCQQFSYDVILKTLFKLLNCILSCETLCINSYCVVQLIYHITSCVTCFHIYLQKLHGRVTMPYFISCGWYDICLNVKYTLNVYDLSLLVFATVKPLYSGQLRFLKKSVCYNEVSAITRCPLYKGLGVFKENLGQSSSFFKEKRSNYVLGKNIM